MSSDKKYDIPKMTKQKIKQIQKNSVDSSVTLAHQAIETYIDLFQHKLPNEIFQLKKIIINTGIKLVKAQPEMAIIFNLVNNVFNEIETKKETEEMITTLKKICMFYNDNLISTNKKISIYTNKIIKNNFSILTHSYSQTVFVTLVQAFQLGKNIHVYVTESRPKKEGVNLAKKLIEHKIPTTLIVDAAVYELLPSIDLVLVGADKITSADVVNKIGTYGLALSAKEMKKPCCVLCGTQKFIPSTNKKIKINKNQNPNEILKIPPKDLMIHNIYFDSTPLDFFSHIISENGKITAPNIKKQICKISIHPKLMPYI